MCTDKKKGGLGVRNLSKLNKALLGKCYWCFANERDTLWRNAISKKFGEAQGGWCSRVNMESFGTGLWKEIRKEWEILCDNTKFLIGNGNKVSFWKDLWCGEKVFCSIFLTLFNLAVYKEALVSDVWDNSEGGRGWSRCLTRSFNDWEMVEVENLLHIIQPLKVIPNLWRVR